MRKGKKEERRGEETGEECKPYEEVASCSYLKRVREMEESLADASLIHQKDQVNERGWRMEDGGWRIQ